jgi:hypothetical protein
MSLLPGRVKKLPATLESGQAGTIERGWLSKTLAAVVEWSNPKDEEGEK